MPWITGVVNTVFLPFGGTIRDVPIAATVSFTASPSAVVDHSVSTTVNVSLSASLSQSVTHVYTDTFTDTAGVTVVNHLPSAGGFWTVVSGTSAVISSANRARFGASSSASVLHYHSFLSTTADCEHSIEVVPISLASTYVAGIIGRYNPATDSCYFFRYLHGQAQLQLLRRVSGVFSSVLASSSYTATVGTTFRLTLAMNGSTIVGRLNDTQVFSYNDETPVSGAGYAGFGLAGTGPINNNNGLHVDNFSGVPPNNNNAADTFSLSAGLTSVADKVASSSASVDLSDALSSVLELPRGLSVSMALDSTASALVEPAPQAESAVDLSDEATALIEAVASVSDVINLSTPAGSGLDGTASIATSMAVDTSASEVAEFAEAVAESVGLSDSPAASRDLPESAEATVSLSVAMSALADRPGTPEDSLGLSDVVVADLARQGEISDALSLSSSTASLKDAVGVVSVALSLSTAAVHQVDGKGTVIANLSLPTLVSARRDAAVQAAESIGFSAAPYVNFDRNVAVAASLGMSASPAAAGPSDASVAQLVVIRPRPDALVESPADVSVYLGRRRRGDRVALSISMPGLIPPDDAPLAILSDESGGTLSTYELPTRDGQKFARELQVGQLPLGKINVRTTWRVLGVPMQKLFSFDVLPGDAGGDVQSLHFGSRPEGNFLLAQLTNGTIVQGRQPSL